MDRSLFIAVRAGLTRLGGRLAEGGFRLAHGLRRHWRGLPADTRRKAVGFPLSVLFHVALIAVFLTTPAARQLGLGPSLEQGGRLNANNGRGLSVSLVSLAQLGEIGRDTPSDAKAVSGAAVGGEDGDHQRPAQPNVDSPLLAGGQTQPGETTRQPSPQARPAAASAAAQGVTTKDAIQSGDADAGQNLLRQIGRCLPPDHRPALAGVSLALNLGPDGQLAAAPSLDINPAQASSGALREANLIVQAALQCGPYQRPSPEVDVYAMAADFSFMGPPGVSPPSVMARHGR